MSVWKRGNVFWAFFTVDGIRYQASTGTANRRQAETIMQKLKEEANARRHDIVQADPQVTFGTLAARFIAEAEPRPHHLDRLKFLLPFFSDLTVRHISRGLADEYRRGRRQRDRVSDATVNRD